MIITHRIIKRSFLFSQEALSIDSVEEQSLFDPYDNQKVPTGKPLKSNDPWGPRKRSLDPDFDDFHTAPKKPSFYEPLDEKPLMPDYEETEKRVIVPAGKKLFIELRMLTFHLLQFSKC